MMLTGFWDYVTLFTICTTETVMLHFTYAALLSRNNRPRYQYYLALSGYFVAVIFTSINSLSIFFVSWLCFFLTLLLAFVFFNETRLVKTTMAFMFVALNYACTIFIDDLIWEYSSLDFSIILKQSLPSQIGLFVLFMLALLIIYKIVHSSVLSRASTEAVFLFIVPSMMLLLVTYLFIEGHSLQSSARSPFGFYLGLSTLLLCIALSLMYWVDRITVIENLSRQKATMEQVLAMQAEYYASLDRQQKLIAGLKHDLANHMNYISFMLEHERIDEVKEYIGELTNNVPSLQNAWKTGNRIFDAMLNLKLMSLPPDITVQIDIIVPPAHDLPFDDVGLCIILGNILDNALESLSKLSPTTNDRFLHIEAKMIKNCLFIECQNSFDGVVNRMDDRYLSMKTDAYSHGIGLTNVQRVVNEHEGTLEILHDNRVFTIKILVPLA